MICKEVKLQEVTKDDAQDALDTMQDIFDEHGLEDDARLKLWELYQTFASDILIRFGEFNPDVGYGESNGHYG